MKFHKIKEDPEYSTTWQVHGKCGTYKIVKELWDGTYYGRNCEYQAFVDDNYCETFETFQAARAFCIAGEKDGAK